jgi:hypothetical protein
MNMAKFAIKGDRILSGACNHKTRTKLKKNKHVTKVQQEKTNRLAAIAKAKQELTILELLTNPDNSYVAKDKAK